MSIPAKLLDRIYVAFVLALSATAFVSIFVNIDSPELSSPVTTIAWLVIYAITIVRLLDRKQEISEVIGGNRPLFLLIGLCCVSILWSVDKSATRHSATSLVLATLIAIDFSIRYSMEEIVRFAAFTFIALILIGIPLDLYVHIIPSNDVDTSNWHGVFGTKNELGRIIVFAVALFFSLPIRSGILKFLFLCATYALLYQVHSTGALVNCTIIVMTILVCIPLRWHRKARTVTLIVIPVLIGAGAYLALAHTAEVTTSVGKDPRLTGRTVLWRLAIRSMKDRPILGYGFGAFWGKSQQLAWRIREAANWLTAPHAHNGYIDTVLSLGAAGLFSLLLLYWDVARKSYKYLQRERSSTGKWPLLYLVFFIVYQITEAGLVTGNNIFWIMFVIVTVKSTSVRARGALPAPVFAKHKPTLPTSAELA